MRTLRYQSGFAMPLAIAFMVILATIGMAVSISMTQAYSNTVQFSYTQVAHAASKGAIDYAEEEYELDENYSGTTELEITSNERYKVTIEVEVLYDQGASAKRIRAYGRVYLPEVASNASYVREIQASIIRNGEVAGNPNDYEPLLWLDANEANSLFEPGASSNNLIINALYGSSSKDIVEEGGSDASNSSNRGDLSFGGDDLEMSWGGNSRGHQNIGLRFRNVAITQAETINSAYIQFDVDETKSAGAIQLTVTGVANDDAPQWTGTYAVTNAPKTTSSTLWEPPNWNNVGDSGVDERVDITAIVQELINRGGWSSGNAMAFTIDYVQGGGIRTAHKGQGGDPVPQLIIDYGVASGGGAVVTDGQSVGTWVDKSLSGHDAVHQFGAYPTFATAVLNGYNAVRFSGDGALRSALSSVVSDENITAFMVMKPSTTNSQANARFLSAMRTTQNYDYNTTNGAMLFARNSSSSTLMNYYNNTIGEDLPSAIDNTWGVYASRISDNYVERLIKNGTDNYTNAINNVSYSIDELFLGGTRSVASGASYAEMDVAEVLVYDRMLSCTQMYDVENYLAIKYGLTISARSC